jgi:hypothetical protein
MPLAFLITGAPALIIILVILALFILGIVYFVKLSARGAKRVLHSDDHAR